MRSRDLRRRRRGPGAHRADPTARHRDRRPGVGGSARDRRRVVELGAQSPEFASLLADAMATDTTASDPLSDSTSDGSDTSIGGSSMISQLMQLVAARIAARPRRLATARRRTRGDARLAALAARRGTGRPIAWLAGIGTGGDRSRRTRRRRPTTTTNATTQTFLSNALAQQGKPYVYGATASDQRSEPDRVRLLGAHEVGRGPCRASRSPTAPTAQYLYIRDHGDTMTVQQALHTPGALLFHFAHEPQEPRRHPRRRPRGDQPRRRRAHDRGPRPRVRHERVRQRRAAATSTTPA